MQVYDGPNSHGIKRAYAHCQIKNWTIKSLKYVSTSIQQNSQPGFFIQHIQMSSRTWNGKKLRLTIENCMFPQSRAFFGAILSTLFNFIKNIYLKKKSPTTVQISRLENIEHETIKQVSYSGKYSLSASRAHQSQLQFSFVEIAFCPRFLQV